VLQPVGVETAGGAGRLEAVVLGLRLELQLDLELVVGLALLPVGSGGVR
jgi:hypothetical protein